MDLGWYPTVLLGSLFWEEALGRLFHLAKCYTSFFFFFFGHSAAYGVLDQGSDLSHSCCCSTARSLTSCARLGLNLHPRVPEMPPILLHHSGNSIWQSAKCPLLKMDHS